MTIAVVALVVAGALAGVTVWALIRALEAAQAESRRLLAIITAPTPNAAHAAALDRPPVRKEREEDRGQLRPIG